jgi:uncharacterized protein (DUF362 family)
MNKLNRQEFLHIAALSLGALAFEPLLSACVKETNPIAPSSSGATRPPDPPASTSIPSPAQASSNEPLAHAKPSLQASPASLPAAGAYLAVARGGNDPEALVRRALAALGGIERFVPKGARVLVKPNICVAYHTYEYAATTNPWVVAALVRLALEAGAKSVQVLDYPFGGSAEEAYNRSGIQEQVLAAGGEMAPMPGFKYVNVDLPQGQDLKQISAFKDALETDVLIDVPIAKHHGLARLTLGMKNLMGLVQDRGAIHHNLGQRVADLASLFQPDLTVVDAVRILMDNGPTGGDLSDVKKLDTVIASADIVAADSYATRLFGLRPDDIAYIPAAAAMGLGRSDLSNLRIEEISI